MDDFSSSHSVIKALKGSDDPPTPGGPSKIAIARKAWESTSIHFLSKDEVLAEWILGSFLRQSKEVSGSKDTILSAKHWLLLGEILSTNPQAPGARSSKIWLSPLLNRISISPIAITFFKNLSFTSMENEQDLVDGFTRCMLALWPFAAARMNLDALTDCFGSILECLSSNAEHLAGIIPVCLLITRAFRQAVGNTSSRKKAFSSFEKQSLMLWIQFVCNECPAIQREVKTLKSEIYQAGVDVFFCLDSLKGSKDPLDTLLSGSTFSPSGILSSQLCIVPMLYKSYLQEMRKHRLAVFGSGSNQSQEQTVQNKFRDCGIRAFALSYKTLRDYGDILEVWKSILTLVGALEEAKIVSHGLSEKTDILSDIVVSAVGVLTERKDDQVERSESALQILCVLSRIDFDLINPYLLEILSGLLTLNPSLYPSTQVLLREILEFHTKTRTVSSYLALLLECFSKNFVDGKVVTQYTVALLAHRECTSGVLLSLAHMEGLVRSIRGFLTPGQTQEAADLALTALQNAWTTFSDAHTVGEHTMDVDVEVENNSEGRKKKRRKTDPEALSTPDPMSPRERAALAYSLTARTVAVVLPSLPFASLSESARLTIKSSVSDAWASYITKTSQDAFKVSSLSGERWAAQCVFASTLRIRHALLTSPELHSLNALTISVTMKKNTFAAISSPEAAPELVVELVRASGLAFFDSDFQTASPQECEAAIDALLSYLITNISPLGAAIQLEGQRVDRWNASASSLDLLEPGGHERGALAVWHLLLDRWLPIFDDIAPSELLRKLAMICLKQIEPDSEKNARPSGISFAWGLERAKRSAAFWELPNLRESMISMIDTLTSHISWNEFNGLLDQTRSTKKKLSPNLVAKWDLVQIQSVLAPFILLLQAPREYIPRNSRPLFFRRALVTDLIVSLIERDSNEVSADICRKTRSIIRAWLVSMSDVFAVGDFVDDLGGYIEYLMMSTDGAEVEVYAITQELLSNAFRQIIRSAVHGEDAQLKGICSLLLKSSSNQLDQGLLTLVEILVEECPNYDKLSAVCAESVKTLYSKMRMSYSNSMTAILYSPTEVTTEGSSKISLWRACLVLRKWLNDSEASDLYGTKLLHTLISSEHQISSGKETMSWSTQIFALLLEEIHIVSVKDHKNHLALIISSYVLFHGRLQIGDRDSNDLAFGRATRSIPVTDYAFLFSLLREALAKDNSSSTEVQTVIHLSSILLGNAPEGAMKVTQELFEEYLHIFSADPKFVASDIDISMEVLLFVGKVCSDKPASLRLLAIGPIWSLLSKFLSGSITHTSKSQERILNAITSIAASLVRLRRDLVASTLPHLAWILRTLLQALCVPRAQLGARQRALISDALPWWIAPGAPLGATEARAIARLLTTLQAKTVPRTFQSKETGKGNERSAEAVIGSFSKHAGSVIGGYVSGLVDPLVVVDASVREALAPGLYTLCEAMGEHGRDALMAGGLDANGRTVLKALWREYEKQRYVGKG